MKISQRNFQQNSCAACQIEWVSKSLEEIAKGILRGTRHTFAFHDPSIPQTPASLRIQPSKSLTNCNARKYARMLCSKPHHQPSMVSFHPSLLPNPLFLPADELIDSSAPRTLPRRLRKQ